MKKTVVLTIAVIVLAITAVVLGVLLWQSGATDASLADGTEANGNLNAHAADVYADSAYQAGNYEDEMKIPYGADISPDDGADSVERLGDHEGSPYFSNIDFYNLESSDTLTMLTHFKTYQQTSEWSCGVAAALMVLEYYGELGDWNEQTLADLRSDHKGVHGGTCLEQMQDIFGAVGGFTYDSTFDYDEDNIYSIDLALIRSYLEEGVPVMVCWIDWGGHWQVVIGYDDMGTEYELDDVLIVADPYDTTDHNQDGYGVYGAERFIYNYSMGEFFKDEAVSQNIFIAAKPAE